MRGMVKFGGLLALMGSPAMAETQTAPCLTQVEATSLFIYMMPEALNGVSKSCQPSLPRTAFLATRSAEMIDRYRVAANASWPQAKTAFLKIGGGSDEQSKIVGGLSDKVLQPLVAETISHVVSKDIKPADCPKIDRVIAALAPLPASNAAELMTGLMGLVGNKGSDGFNLCRE